MAYCKKCGTYSGRYELCKECFKESTSFEATENLTFEEQTSEEVERTCPICGQPTSVWYGNARKDGLCRAHAQDLKNGKIKQDGITLYFTDAQTGEILNAEYKKQQEQNTNAIITIDSNNKSRCLICGRKTDGVLFCKTHFSEYVDKELLFKIKNCAEVELLDANYEGRYICKDGHVVKSKSERDIDNYLFENNIPHGYEIAVNYGECGEKQLHPDFKLPNYLGEGKDVYIEHWGYNENNINYTNTKKYKIEIYREQGITLICTHEKKDTSDIQATLRRKLNKKFIKEGQINFENE